VNSHYSKDELVSTMRSLGIIEGDVLFCHSNVGYLGMPEGVKSKLEALDVILKGIREVIGEEGTLTVPTFTYSFGTDDVFCLDVSPSNCGMFSEFVREQPYSIRSCDPSVSVAAVGNKAKELTRDLPINAYCQEAFFGRLLRAKAKIFNINFDAGSTFLHYVERESNVPYRYDKTFSGEVLIDGNEYLRESTIWVRDLNIPGSESNFDRFNEAATEKNIFKRASIGRGTVGVMEVEDAFSLLSNLIKKNTWILTNVEKE